MEKCFCFPSTQQDLQENRRVFKEKHWLGLLISITQIQTSPGVEFTSEKILVYFFAFLMDIRYTRVSYSRFPELFLTFDGVKTVESNIDLNINGIFAELA